MAEFNVSRVCRKCKNSKSVKGFSLGFETCMECTASRISGSRKYCELTEEEREHRRKIAAGSRARRSESTKQKWKDYAKRWYRENKEKRYAYSSKRRARIFGNGGSHTATEWKQLLSLFGGKCLRCGSKEKISRDHVVPINDGGTDNIENLQPLCMPCNHNKSQTIIDYRLRSKVVLTELNAVGKAIYEGKNEELVALRERKTASGILGVSLNQSPTRTEKTTWRARMMIGGVDKTIGYFATKEEAAAARSSYAASVLGVS